MWRIYGTLTNSKKIKERFSDEVLLSVKEFREQVAITLKKNRILEICRYLHDDPSLYFDYLVDVCGVDYLGEKRRNLKLSTIFIQ